MIRIQIQGVQNSKEIHSDDQVISIGKSRENEISLPEEGEILDRHLKIVQTGNQGYLLLPQSSSAPGLLNGEPLKSRSLQSGDVFQIGKIKISFFLTPDKSSGPEAKTPPSTPEIDPSPSFSEKGQPQKNKDKKEEDTFIITSLHTVLKDPPSPKEKPETVTPPPQSASPLSEEVAPPQETLGERLQKIWKPIEERLLKGWRWSIEKAREYPKFAGLATLAGILLFLLVFILLFKGSLFSTREIEKPSPRATPVSRPAAKILGAGKEARKQIELLGDPSLGERIRATKKLKSLLAQKLPEVRELLEDAARRHPDPVVRWRARWVLETGDSPDLEDPLKKILTR